MKDSFAPTLHAALRGRWEPVYRSQLNYLLVWGTRGRKPVLKSVHISTLHDLIPRLCEERGFSLLELAVADDHVHVLIGLRPSQSVATAVREIKGRSAGTLLTRHPELRVWLGGNLVWDERYAVETVSPARIAKVRSRLRAFHGGHEGMAAAG